MVLGIRLDLINATDATSSADGQVLIIRMYVGAFLWPRTSRSKSIVEKLRNPECLVSVGMQRQGESVALYPSGQGGSYGPKFGGSEYTFGPDFGGSKPTL